MEKEASFGFEKACLRRLRESRLKSETVSTLIRILSRIYEDPNALAILSPAPTRPEGVSGTGEKVVQLEQEGVSDGDVMEVDVVKDVSVDEVKDLRRGDDGDRRMEFSVDEIENMILDVDVMGGPVEGKIVDQEALKQVESSLLEAVGSGNQVAESLKNENGFSNDVEVGFAGEAAQCKIGDDKFLHLQRQRLDGPDDALECGDVQKTSGSDVIEGKTDNDDAKVPSHVSMKDNIDIVQNTDVSACQINNREQGKVSVEVSCPDFSSSGLVSNVNDNGKDHRAYSDACAEYASVKLSDTGDSVSGAKISATIPAVAKDEFRCPVDRRPVFYGDISEETSLNAQGTILADVDYIKKKRAGNKERKKIKKRKKRAEMDKKLGVKRMKLPPALKPKVVKVCEHYLKGRCLKGGECTFSHDATPLTKSKACIHFARNNCMRGDACPYDHELWKYPCDNYTSKGFCNRGSNCLFSHELMPSKEVSQRDSIAEEISLQAAPGTASKSSVNSAAKLSMNPPKQVPKGLSFLSLGKSGSPEKVDLMGSNHSSLNVPCMAQTLDVTSKPLAPPVSSNNLSILEAQSDHYSSNKNSSPNFGSCKKRVDLTSPLDQALLGLNSLVSRKVSVNRSGNVSTLRLSEKEHNHSVSRLSGLKMNHTFNSSVEKEKPSVVFVDQKWQISKSKSQAVANTCGGVTQEKVSSVHCFSTPTSTLKPRQKLNTIIPEDSKSDKLFSTHDRGKRSIYDSPLTISAEVTSPASVNSPNPGMTAIKSICVQKALLSSSTIASKFDSETKGSTSEPVENSQLQTKPENCIASSSKSTFKCEPVKASAILDFIFGTGPKPK